jgi:D-alanyl-D-alanine carboxypeptidase
MILWNGTLANAMRRNGWSWGARWAHPDYQHFSSNGG